MNLKLYPDLLRQEGWGPELNWSDTFTFQITLNGQWFKIMQLFCFWGFIPSIIAGKVTSRIDWVLLLTENTKAYLPLSCWSAFSVKLFIQEEIQAGNKLQTIPQIRMKTWNLRHWKRKQISSGPVSGVFELSTDIALHLRCCRCCCN